MKLVSLYKEFTQEKSNNLEFLKKEYENVHIALHK